jgi:hypothetical protein
MEVADIRRMARHKVPHYALTTTDRDDGVRLDRIEVAKLQVEESDGVWSVYERDNPIALGFGKTLRLAIDMAINTMDDDQSPS